MFGMKRETLGYALVAGLTAMLIVLAFSVRLGITAALDSRILLVSEPIGAMVPIVSAITWFGDSLTRIIVTAIMAAALLVRRDPRRASAIVLIVAGGAALESALKAIVGRPRPELLPHLDHVTSASFPSGHAANGAILYFALALLIPARRRPAALLVAVALVLAIGLSRVSLAVHWPTDVLAGWCLGVAWVFSWRHRLVAPPRG